MICNIYKMTERLRSKIENAFIKVSEIIRIYNTDPEINSFGELQNYQNNCNQQIEYLVQEIRQQEIDYETIMNYKIKALQMLVFEKRQVLQRYQRGQTTFEALKSYIEIIASNMDDERLEMQDAKDLFDKITDFKNHAAVTSEMIKDSKFDATNRLETSLYELNTQIHDVIDDNETPPYGFSSRRGD